MDRKLKRVVIKEELVELTGDYKKALILNQFLYWSERVKDFDNFIIEENKRKKVDSANDLNLTHGWIYKTAKELSEEIMVNLSESNIRIHINILIDNGWLIQRANPKYKWDKTIQYRVNILKIQEDLQELGFNLDGYSSFKIEDGNFKTEDHTSCFERAIPETTTETTTETTKKNEKNIRVQKDLHDTFSNLTDFLEAVSNYYKSNSTEYKILNMFYTNFLKVKKFQHWKLSEEQWEKVKTGIEYMKNIGVLTTWKDIETVISVYFESDRKNNYHSLQDFSNVSTLKYILNRLEYIGTEEIFDTDGSFLHAI